MAASGVTVQDKVVTEYNNIKLGRQYQCIVMKLTKDDKEIELEKTIPANACTFEEFVSQLPKDDCRYAVYDFHFDTPNAGQRQQLILILWYIRLAPRFLPLFFCPVVSGEWGCLGSSCRSAWSSRWAYMDAHLDSSGFWLGR